MLIEFTVKNYRSIKDEQVFSMVKAKGNELEDENTFSPGPSLPTLLRSAVIYGANAAGKSNFINSLSDMEFIVRNSSSHLQEGDLLPFTPFKFDDDTIDKPSEFEVVFVNDGVKYQYGFTATRERILEEWLIAFPKGRSQRWFSRVFDETAQQYDYKFSEHFTGTKQVWLSSTRSNALFLSTAVQLNSTQLKPVFDWFKDNLKTSTVKGWSPAYTASLSENPEGKNRVLGFLQSADFSISDIEIEKEDHSHLLKKLPKQMLEIMGEKLEGIESVEVKTVHKTKSGRSVVMDFSEESDGTRKFFSFAGPWIDILDNGYTLIVDELHDNLHPHLVKHLVGLFHNPETNPKNAQLIFTTHETSILNQEVFRRDQVWFCERNSHQETAIYPLTDFNPRKGRENVEVSYLSGRYGAIPFIDLDISLTGLH